MSAYSTEEIAESFKFLPRFNLDKLLLVSRQWNQLIKRFERQLHVRRLSVHIYSKVRLEPSPDLFPGLMKPDVRKSFEYIHLENQVICPHGPHKALFSCLDSYIRNAVVTLSLMSEMPPGLMCLIKDLVEGQIQRNCSIISIYHHGSQSVLNGEISLAELLKASFLSADKSFSLLKPIGEIKEVGPYMRAVDYFKIVFSTANRLQQTVFNCKPVPQLAITWHFNYNFPEQFIEIFKNSRKDDWPEHIVVTPVGELRPAPRRLTLMSVFSDSIEGLRIKELSELEFRAQSILEYIWPNSSEICPDLHKKPMEIVHPRNSEDGRRLTIEFTMNPNRNSDYICSFIFKTISMSPDFVKYDYIFRRTF